jgi:TolB-like protein
MTKTMIIQFDEKDEGFLLTFFKKMKVITQQVPEINEEDAEPNWVKQQLRNKYVKSGKWETMTDDVRQDAVLVEMMAYSTLTDDSYMNDTDATVFLEQLKNGTYGSPNQ